MRSALPEEIPQGASPSDFSRAAELVCRCLDGPFISSEEEYREFRSALSFLSSCLSATDEQKAAADFLEGHYRQPWEEYSRERDQVLGPKGVAASYEGWRDELLSGNEAIRVDIQESEKIIADIGPKIREVEEYLECLKAGRDALGEHVEGQKAMLSAREALLATGPGPEVVEAMGRARRASLKERLIKGQNQFLLDEFRRAFFP